MDTSTSTMIRRWARLILGCLCLASSAQVAGQGFPSKEVRIIVPQAPGGASDALARLVGAKLAERWGQPVIVENKIGANGNIGTSEAAKAPADGHTLLLTYAGTHATSPALYANLPWDPIRDFAAVAPVATLPFVMVVNSKLPAKNLRELIDLAKTRELHNASPGSGSMNHLLGEQFSRSAGVKMIHVPYKGISQALTDLIGERVEVTFSSLQSVVPHLKAGTLRAIALTSAKRSELMPELPTLAELGLKDFDVNPWFGVLAPAATPPALVARVNRDINDVINAPDVKARFTGIGAVPLAMSPEAFDAQIKSDLARWGNVVRYVGIKID